jgi:hypothetical protein
MSSGFGEIDLIAAHPITLTPFSQAQKTVVEKGQCSYKMSLMRGFTFHAPASPPM